MPVRDEVIVKMSAQEAGMVQAWMEAKRGPDSFAESMEKMGRRGKRSVDTLGGAFDSFVAKWTSITAVINIAQQALTAFMEANKRAIQEGKTATQTIDESVRKLMVQADMRRLGMNQAQLTQIIGQSAVKSATNVPFASAMATQAISSGFGAKDILQGGGLDSLLAFSNATNSTDQDPAQLVKAVGLFLSSTGQQLNSKNLQRTLVGTQRLFKGTNMQASALPFLAREGAQISSFGNMGGDDVLSIGSVLLNTLGEQKAATAFRGTISDMALMGKDPSKVKALGQLGLKTTDVDMVGESFVTALERINTAANKLDPSVRNVVLGRMFKEESMPGVLALMSDQGRAQIATNRRLMSDTEGFASDVGIATSGAAAQMRRGEVRRQLAMDQRGFGEAAMALDRERLRSIESGESPLATWAGESVGSGLTGLGVGGESAARTGRFLTNPLPQLMGNTPNPNDPNLMQKMQIILKDEDNRTIPTEPVGKGIEAMGQ